MKRAIAYELMVVVAPTVDVSDEPKQRTFVEKLLGERASTIKSITHAGKKQLAYEQKKQVEGQYLVMQLEGALVRVDEIEKRVRLDATVLSFFLKRAKK